MKKIVLTGPESTGKTTLAKALAQHFDGIWVEEYAREYLGQLGREYNQSDLIHIAKGQLKKEQEAVLKAPAFLFCDTGMLVLKIWSEYKYGTCDSWILEEFANAEVDLYLLCTADIPWKYDPMREYPESREDLFILYEKALRAAGKPFEVISGTVAERLQKAATFILEK